MGEGVLGHISKGIVLTKVDAVVNHLAAAGTSGGPWFDLRQTFLESLRAANTEAAYRQVLESQALVSTDESNYLGETWYQPTGWWSNPAAIFAVVRRGLIKAIEMAGDQLPLDSYWLPAAPSGVIEVIVCRSAQQVTRIILTPPSGGPQHPRPTPREMWVVKPRIGQEQEGFETYDEVVESADGNVVTWRVRDMPNTVTWQLP